MNDTNTMNNLGLGRSAVFSLTNNLCLANQKLYFDVFSSSIALMEVLQGPKPLAFTTIKSTRKGFS